MVKKFQGYYKTHKNLLQISQHMVEAGGNILPPSGFKIQKKRKKSFHLQLLETANFSAIAVSHCHRLIQES